jgi:hypothetical protein
MWWSERWTAPDDRVTAVGRHMQSFGAPAVFGAGYERWDLECRGGLLASARARVAVEEHGGRRQLVRARLWPRFTVVALGVLLMLAALAAAAAVSDTPIAAAILGLAAAVLGARMIYESAAAIASILHALTATQGGTAS